MNKPSDPQQPQYAPNEHLFLRISKENAFTPEECQRIIQVDGKFEMSSTAPYRTSATNKVDRAVRRSRSKPVGPAPENMWIVERIASITRDVNQQFFKFEIDHMEGIQVIEYNEGDYFDWHVDLGSGHLSFRKLSVVVMLSPQENYTGGALKLRPNFKDMNFGQGAVVVFPSYVSHIVEPILTGQRYSLVTWVSGPPFR